MLRHLRQWLGQPPVSPRAAAPAVLVRDRIAPLGAAGELTTLETLWSEGFSGPGRAEPVLALARTLGLGRGPVLLVGAGLGGPAIALASLGRPVAAYEADAAALLRARTLAARHPPAGLSLHPWDLAAPDFGTASYDHAVLLDPGAPQALVPAVAAALRPGGRIAMAAVVADRPAGAGLVLPSEMAVTRAFLRAGLEVLETADSSAAMVAQARADWAQAVLAMGRDTPCARATVLAEAERWCQQVLWLQTGQLRLVRWLAGLPRTGAAAAVDSRARGP